MIRRPRNYLNHLISFWASKYPHRPPKTIFSEEILCAVEFIMWQIDPAGSNPIKLPPMPAYEGYEPQPNVRSKGHVEIEG